MKRIQPFDALDAATEAALHESIKRFGVIVPIVVDQHGRVLDGHHRKRIAEKLGVNFRADVHKVKDDKEALAVSRTLNAVRRHLPANQRREIVAALRKEGHSLRAIGKALKVGEATVRRDLTGAPHDAPRTVTGQDGKSYPSTRPPDNGKAEALLEGMKTGDRKRVQQILDETHAPPRAASKIASRWDAASEEQKDRIWKAYRQSDDSRERSAALTTLADTVPEPDMRAVWCKTTAAEARKQSKRYPNDAMNPKYEEIADRLDKLAEETRKHHDGFIQSKKEAIHEP